MKFAGSAVVCFALGLMLVACAPAPESGRGFRLPDGDPDLGKQVFLDMQCHACHTIQGMELPSFQIEAPVSVNLGGPVARVQTYGQLVTSIINPSHRLMKEYPEAELYGDGESLMPIMNYYMTVQQLIDLVAFLQIQYEVVVPDIYPYSAYSYE